MRQSCGLVLVAIAFLLLALGGAFSPGAVLAQDATPSAGVGQVSNHSNPAIGDTVSYITENGSESAELRVTNVILPWDEYGQYYEPDRGSRYVAFVIEITNFGSRGSLVVRADDFRVQDVDGFFYSRSWADAADGATIVPTESDVAIAPGATEEMIVVYPVLEGVALSHLFWQPEFDRLITIANLDSLKP